VNGRIELEGDARRSAVEKSATVLRNIGVDPRTVVPLEILERDSSRDATSTKLFLDEFLLDGNSTGSLRRLKVLLVGEANAGKTSLFNALSTGEANLVPPGADRATPGVKVSELILKENSLCCNGVDRAKQSVKVAVSKGGVLSVWDFGGQIEYYGTHAFFLTRRSLVILVVDLSIYKCSDESFEKNAGRWLRILMAQLVSPKVILVGTKMDLVKPATDVAKKMDDMVTKMESLKESLKRKISLGVNRMSRFRFSRSSITEEERRTRDVSEVSLISSMALSSCGALDGIGVLREVLAEQVATTLGRRSLPRPLSRSFCWL